ncbi:nucleopolyhedrovirus P10 family protein [Streptomyces sp. NPDC005526]|uniref:nucleopolyhedrovirus P10 family protein n=1 Tax=Streptomyces sp. NPDC005526 TaxID=3156885 RepID=UPI0033A3A4CC
MTADGWTRTVRHQLALGRILPLGGPSDGAWIVERAAEAVLRRAAGRTPGVRLGTLRITLADPASARAPAVPAPPSALPPGDLRVSADFAATADEPLPTTAARLRETLATAAARALGLTVTEVDLRVTALLTGEAEMTGGFEGTERVQGAEGAGTNGAAPAGGPAALGRAAGGGGGAEEVRGGGGAGEAGEAEGTAEAGGAESPGSGEGPAGTDVARVSAAVLAVPGVLRLTGALGGMGRPVHLEERRAAAALPHRHVRVEVALRADQRAVEVARQVRAAVAEALPDHPSVAVLVTAID